MTMRQHNPPHIGGLIYRTYIEPFDDVSANKIADASGVERSTFNRLLNGISALLSHSLPLERELHLGFAFFMPVRIWF